MVVQIQYKKDKVSGGSTLVEYLSHHLSIEGSNHNAVLSLGYKMVMAENWINR
jgi:hypothetical protein